MRAVASTAPERFQNKFTLGIGHRMTHKIAYIGHRSMVVDRQRPIGQEDRSWGDQITLPKNDRPMHGVFEFSHVAAPVVPPQQAETVYAVLLIQFQLVA